MARKTLSARLIEMEVVLKDLLDRFKAVESLRTAPPETLTVEALKERMHSGMEARGELGRTFQPWKQDEDGSWYAVTELGMATVKVILQSGKYDVFLDDRGSRARWPLYTADPEMAKENAKILLRLSGYHF